MKCPECRNEITEDMKFCGRCGCALGRVCAHCLHDNPPHFRFCSECGQPLVPPPVKQEKAPEADGPKRILVVDDETTVVELAQDLLEMVGYVVTVFTDSTGALSLFTSDPSRFDLVITDQNMPNLTGLELARKILGIRNNIPIILFTGDDASTPPDMAKEAGISEFLTKPFTFEMLTDAVRRVLDRAI